jgi:DNA ligase-associated metallophosphoesterase
MNSPDCRIPFAGHELVLDGSGVLYWPDEQLLVASDLHFEKGSFLAQHGSIIPPYDTLDTLERLEQIINRYQPKRLVLLGDSFHDRHAWERLDATLRLRLEQMVNTVEQVFWIEGNHDIGLDVGYRLTSQLHVRDMLFTHDHVPDAMHQVIGHYHPRTLVKLGSHKVGARCFVVTNTCIIMPAFGSYTGGLDIMHPAIREIAGEGELRAYFIYRSCVYPMLG